MKIAILCPQFPPDSGGVSDYVGRLSGELAHQSHEVRVFTACSSPAPPPGVTTESFPGIWNLKRLRKIEEALQSWRPDGTVIQYTPYLYGPDTYGLRPAFPYWLRGLRTRIGGKTAVLVHELHYPMGFTPDRLLIGTPQFAQFLAIACLAEELWFTNEVSRNRVATLLPFKARKLHWLPVGATIEPIQGPGKAESKSSAHPGEKILLQFGSAHPSRLFDLSFRALRDVNASGSRARLLFIGMSSEEVTARLRQFGATDLGDHVEGLGYLSAADTSAWMNRADAVLAPFIDGISTRRTSAMAALAHGRPLVTTVSYTTDPSVSWRDFCAVSSPDPQAFSAQVLRVLSDSALAGRLGISGRQAYETHFSWPVLARNLVGLLHGRERT